MTLSLNNEARISLLSEASKRLGGKAALGRALGYKDGAFVGQMLRGERPITEKTLAALSEVNALSDLLKSFAIAELPNSVATQSPGEMLTEALEVIAAAMSSADDLTRDQIRPLLDRWVKEPARGHDIANRIRALLLSTQAAGFIEK